MLTQYAFSILFIDKKKAKFSNDRFGLKGQENAFTNLLYKSIRCFRSNPQLPCERMTDNDA